MKAATILIFSVVLAMTPRVFAVTYTFDGTPDDIAIPGDVTYPVVTTAIWFQVQPTGTSFDTLAFEIYPPNIAGPPNIAASVGEDDFEIILDFESTSSSLPQMSSLIALGLPMIYGVLLEFTSTNGDALVFFGWQGGITSNEMNLPAGNHPMWTALVDGGPGPSGAISSADATGQNNRLTFTRSGNTISLETDLGTLTGDADAVLSEGSELVRLGIFGVDGMSDGTPVNMPAGGGKFRRMIVNTSPGELNAVRHWEMFE
jgi:hypothetical protein